MSACTIGGVQKKPELDAVLFKIQWADLLALGEPYINTNDRIATSTWAFDAESPAGATVTLGADGFDAQAGVTWIILAGGNENDVVYVNNSITTSGVQVNGVSTPSQTFVRQIRVRVQKC